MSYLMDDMAILIKNQKMRNQEFMRDINRSQINIINLEDDRGFQKDNTDESSNYERILNDSVDVTKERRSAENGASPSFGRGYEAFGKSQVSDQQAKK